MMETTLGIDVIGVVRPEARAGGDAHAQRAASGCSPRPRPCASGAYERAVGAADPHVDLVSVPCPDLAPIIQGGFPFDEERRATPCAATASRCARRGVDTVILGCTHYPLVRPMLQRILGRGVAIVSPPGEALARQVEHALGSRDLANPREGEGDYSFLCTGDPEAFRALGTRFLQLPLGAVEQVELRGRRVSDPLLRARGRRTCARRRSSPASSRRPPGRRSSRRARRG